MTAAVTLVVFLIFSTLVLSFFVLPVNAAIMPFYSETVDSGVRTGQYSSIAVDSSNNPCVSYYQVGSSQGSGSLKYAKWSGTAWNIQTVDSVGDVGDFCSLALDSNNNPGISFYDRNAADLMYAKWNGTAWNIQTVDASGGTYTSLAFDSNNNPQISYFTGSLKYAKWTGTTWNIQTVDQTVSFGGLSSLAIDSSNNPQISYLNFTKGFTNYDLKCAKLTGTTWSIQTVASGRLQLILLFLFVPSTYIQAITRELPIMI